MTRLATITAPSTAKKWGSWPGFCTPFSSEATIGGHTGTLIVKRNYGLKGVEEGAVLMNPSKHLGTTTVMFKRESGYDADNNGWFWAKYLPDGSLDKNIKGMQLAGRVAKGAPRAVSRATPVRPAMTMYSPRTTSSSPR